MRPFFARDRRAYIVLRFLSSIAVDGAVELLSAAVGFLLKHNHTIGSPTP